jgi:hypothetical protein
MLIPPFPVDRIRTAVDHTFFDMLWLFDYYTIFCIPLFFSPFLLFFCIRCQFTFICEPLGHLIAIGVLSVMNKSAWWRHGVTAAKYHSYPIIRNKSCVVS